MIRKRTLTKYMILLGGLYATGMGLWRLGQTAIFWHESEVTQGVVVDVRERPFESLWEMLSHGNLPWEGSVAHQPHVTHKYAGKGSIDRSLPDWDTHDYNRGETVEIRVHPERPEERHLNKFKFIWGKHLIMLGLGLAALLIFRLTRRRYRRKSAPRKQPTIVEKMPLPKAVEAAVKAVAETAPAPKKRRRASKPKDPNAPAKPGAKKSSKSPATEKAPTAAPKKRRRKTKDSTQV